ncbi:toll/interleukin-1 receptor domain-containing protein, partial [Flavobacterium beibuense]|uniref:toll/interleukin-1 receptor domain-containing protein n=1 Tax=Flavobacterium beibuense TaxID=657326 RepID=UPI003A8D34B4
ILNSKGLSTSRKAYFYRILMDFNQKTRIEIINRIKEEIGSNNGKLIEPKQNISTNSISKLDTKEETSPKIFISYSWDSEEHKDWVRNLADKLIENGIEVILDQYELRPGKNMLHFMDTAIQKADKVLIIFTENYKLKADKRKGGVGYEYSICNIDLFKQISDNEKYIPALRNGTYITSIPEFIQQFISIDMTNDEKREEYIKELISAIYNKPKLTKPQIGTKPDYI